MTTLRKLLFSLIGLVVVALSISPAQAQAVSGRVSAEQPTVVYALSASSGSTITVHVERSSGDLIPFLALRGANNRVIARSDVTATGRTAALDYTFIETGDYELTVTRMDADTGTTTGDFILSISGVSVTSAGFPSSLGLSAFDQPAVLVTQSRTFEAAADAVTSSTYYLFYLRAGQSLDASMERIDGDLRPTLVLTDVTLSRIIARGNIALENQSTLQVTIAETGWYSLVAARFDLDLGTTAGRYRLSINFSQ